MTRLTTLQTVADTLGMKLGSNPQHDRLIKRYIKAGSDLFERLVGVSYTYESEIEESLASSGNTHLHGFSTLPLKNVHEIRYKQQEPVDEDLYRIDGHMIVRETGSWRNTHRVERGFIRDRVSTYQKRKDYHVTYDAGYITPYQAEKDESLERDLPFDIEDAIIEYVKFRFLNSDVNERISSESTDQWSISYMDGVEVPSTFEEVVKAHRIRSI